MTTIPYRPVGAALACALRDATDIEAVGGKAFHLARMMSLGLPVPDGFVLTTAAFAMGAGSVDDVLRDRGSALLREGPVVVRSSALGEDSATDSFAGQLDSFLNITDEAALARAVLACWASCWSDRAVAYRAARGLTPRGMGVIVQRQVDAIQAGVMFTRTAEGLILVEHTVGLGDRLVAGEIDPSCFAMGRDGRDVRVLATGPGVSPLPPKAVAELASIATRLEDAFSGPQDVEWVLDAEGVKVVQTRPVTASVVTPVVTTGHGTATRWSNANISENFPEPVTPLLYSIVSAGYAHYFRNLARAFGLSPRRIAAMDDALRHVVGVHSARLYYNLTSIHTILGAAPFGVGLTAAFNRFVGTDGSEGKTIVPPARGLREWRELAWIALKTTWTYLTIERRLSAFERTIDDFAERTHPSRLSTMPLHDLRLRLAELMDIRCNRWTSASLADAAAMVTYASLHRLISRAYRGENADSLHNSLLKAIPGLVSGEPVHRLWELSRLLRENRSDEFRIAFDDYLERWGFRCSAELMLTVPSYQEDPSSLMDTIRAYAALDGESPAESLARQLREREAETKEMLAATPLVYRPIISTVLRWTQASIALRERARLKQALLYSRCRRLALALGDRLLEVGVLRQQEDIFWLTVSEIDELTAGTAMLPGKTQALVDMRRAEHAIVSAHPAPDSFTTGFGLQVAGCGLDQQPAGLTGTPACGGSATGRATVLKDVSEAARLAEGDILVTRQTDPGWAPVFFLIKGLVIERGGMLSHGAIVAREFGIPCVVGVREATTRLRDGGRITVDGNRGEVHVLD